MNKFSIHCLDRNTHAGGLICYVKETIPHRNRPYIAVNKDGIKSIVIQIRTSKKKLLFLHVYNPLNVHINYLSSALEGMLIKCLPESEIVFIIGDLGINFDIDQNHLSKICDTCNLKLSINKATGLKFYG